MYRFTSSIRRPVKRQGAEQYLFITLVSFAFSVILTRLFLELTGYPQLGGSQFHIAHVLWGGLLLFIAALLPLIMANRWVYTAGAILAGTGVGLFIDEVGKFITQTNDYFTPLAAPIVYAFFLMTVMLYLRVRRPPSRSPRAELFRAFDAMEEVLELDFDPREREELIERLKYVAEKSDRQDLTRLANDLLEYLSQETITLVPQPQTTLGRIMLSWRDFEARWLSRTRMKAILIGGLLAVGLVTLTNMILALPIGSTVSLERLVARLIEQGRIGSTLGLNWYAARLALEYSVGILLLFAAGLLIASKDRLGIAFGYLSLLLSLTVVNLLVFYFEQFRSIITATVQLTLLMGVAYYRQRFLVDSPPPQSNEFLSEKSEAD